MTNDSIDLERVRIRYDRKDGALRLTSADPRLKGKAFMLTLSRESSAVRTLLELFAAEGIIGENELIPDSVELRSLSDYEDGLDEYAIAGTEKPLRDTRLLFPAGKATNSQTVTIDLGYAAHTLVTGAPRTGKSSLLRSFAQQAGERHGEVLILDPLWEDLGRMVPGLEPNSVASGFEDSERLLGGVLEELRDRIAKLDRTGLENSVGYEASFGSMGPIFLFADALDSFESVSWLSELLEGGQRAGIYLFATAGSAFSLPQLTDDSVLLNFGRRITMGRPLSTSEDRGISPRLLSNLGRGVLQSHGSKPTVLQFVRSR